jgi:uncharacterized protein
MASNGLSPASAAILGGLTAIGISIGGALIGNGFFHSRMADRFVTVRGLVERAAKADLGIWTISFTATGDDLAKANDQIAGETAIVIAFVKAQGFSDNEISLMPTSVEDLWARRYGSNEKPPQRYVLVGQVELRSGNVDRIRDASQKTSALIEKGVVLSFAEDGGRANPTYLFTKLNDIRPSMLAEATRSARAVAQQFAADSGSNLGGIRQANQGVFEILSTDASSASEESRYQFGQEKAIDKKIRLVSTIEYYLTN